MINLYSQRLPFLFCMLPLFAWTTPFEAAEVKGQSYEVELRTLLNSQEIDIDQKAGSIMECIRDTYGFGDNLLNELEKELEKPKVCYFWEVLQENDLFTSFPELFFNKLKIWIDQKLLNKKIDQSSPDPQMHNTPQKKGENHASSQESFKQTNYNNQAAKPEHNAQSKKDVDENQEDPSLGVLRKCLLYEELKKEEAESIIEWVDEEFKKNNDEHFLFDFYEDIINDDSHVQSWLEDTGFSVNSNRLVRKLKTCVERLFLKRKESHHKAEDQEKINKIVKYFSAFVKGNSCFIYDDKFVVQALIISLEYGGFNFNESIEAIVADVNTELGKFKNDESSSLTEDFFDDHDLDTIDMATSLVKDFDKFNKKIVNIISIPLISVLNSSPEDLNKKPIPLTSFKKNENAPKLFGDVWNNQYRIGYSSKQDKYIIYKQYNKDNQIYLIPFFHILVKKKDHSIIAMQDDCCFISNYNGKTLVFRNFEELTSLSDLENDQWRHGYIYLENIEEKWLNKKGRYIEGAYINMFKVNGQPMTVTSSKENSGNSVLKIYKNSDIRNPNKGVINCLNTIKGAFFDYENTIKKMGVPNQLGICFGQNIYIPYSFSYDKNSNKLTIKRN